ASGSNSELGDFLGGPVRSKQMPVLGFPPSRDDRWKELAAGLNARPDLPPLLWQTPDGEESWNMETWTELRTGGAQIDWYLYPDEGHVKRYPANKWWVYSRNLDWFRFWLKDEEDPDPAKAEQYQRWRKMRTEWEAAKIAAAQV